MLDLSGSNTCCMVCNKTNPLHLLDEIQVKLPLVLNSCEVRILPLHGKVTFSYPSNLPLFIERTFITFLSISDSFCGLIMFLELANNLLG